MADEPEETPTSWKQFRVRTNLGTLVSILVALGLVLWQGMEIRTQIDGNSGAVEEMAYAVGELTGAVSLANELDTRTNMLFDEIGSLRDQYQDQADVWIEISTLSERIDVARNQADSLRGDVESSWHQANEFRVETASRLSEFDSARNDLSDLEWRVDDLDRRVAEAFGAEMASGGGDDYGFQITDLIRQVAELQGRQNASNDLEWQIDDLTRQLTDLRVRVETSGGVEQWQVDDLYERSDEMFDMIWRMWAALETQGWATDLLYDD
jgi:hypothetical protein